MVDYPDYSLCWNRLRVVSARRYSGISIDLVAEARMVGKKVICE